MRGATLQGLGQGIANAGRDLGDYFAKMNFKLQQEQKAAEAEAEKAKAAEQLNRDAMEDISKIQMNIGGAMNTGGFGSPETRREISEQEFGQRELGEQFKTGEQSPFKYAALNLSPKTVTSDIGKAYLGQIEKIKEPEREDVLNTQKFEFEKQKWKTEREDKLNKEAKEVLSPEQASNANNLRAQYIKLSDGFINVRDSYNRIESVGKKVSAAGDLALIFNYMKMLDPGSTVREGEFANAQNAGGIPDKMRSAYNRVANGQRLSEDQRKDFLDQSKNLFESANSSHKKLKNQYSKLSSDMGINPKFVTSIFDNDSEDNNDMISQAQSALSDPNATPEEKAAAQKILRGGR